MSLQKRWQSLLRSPNNVRFVEFVLIVKAFGFRLLRTSGSHHIFGRQGIPEQINIQNVKGRAKPYQIRQFLKLVEKYNLTMEQS